MPEGTGQQGADFDRVRDVFTRAREIDDQAEREAYLKREISGDASLRARVDDLLHHHFLCKSDPAAVVALPARAAASAAWAAVSDAPSRQLPERIGPYQVLGRLGEGGMATVYRVQQEQPRREVALKVLHLMGAHASASGRFRQEAEVLARLQHEGIAQIYDVGTATTADGERAYLTMELVEGRDLLRHAQEHALDKDARLELVLQVLDAVAHAHQRAIIHRDIKPSNVLVTARGRAKLLDFGIARVLDEESTHTRTRDVIGTLRYLTPEQAAGTSRGADTRVDVYAIGVMLYELLGDAHPYAASSSTSAELLRALVSSDPTPLTKLDPTVSADLATVVHKAIARDPVHRYPTADALAADLRRFRAGQPVLAQDPTFTYQLRKFVARNRGLVAALSAGVLALVVGLVLALSFAREAHDERRRADARTEQASRAAALLRLQAATTALHALRVGEAARRLDQIDLARRRWPWAYLQASLDTSIDKVALASGNDPVVVRVTPDGRLARGSQNDVKFLEALTATSTRSRRIGIATPDGMRPLLQSKRGRPVPWLPQHRARITSAVMRIEQERGDVVARLPELRAKAFDLHPAKPWVLVGSWDRTVVIWDPAQGVLGRPIRVDGAVHAVCWDDEGARFAVGTASGAIRIFDTTTREVRETLLGHQKGVNRLAFVLGGRFLVSMTNDAIRLWEPGLRDALSQIAIPRIAHEIPNDFVYGVASSPDSRRLASVSWDASLRIVDRASMDVLATFRDTAAEAHYDVAFTPDGSKVVVKARSSFLIRAADTGHLLARVPRAGASLRFALSLDGEDVYWLRRPERVPVGLHLADLSTRWLDCVPSMARGKPWLRHGRDYMPLAFSSDGAYVAARSHTGYCVWSTVDGALLREIPLDFSSAGIRAMRFRPGTQELITAGPQRDVLVFDVTTGALRRRLAGHGGRVFALALHPDGRVLASGADDGTVRLWDLDTGEALLVLSGHGSYVHDLAFTPDGTDLVSGSGDGTTRLWSTRPLRERLHACQDRRARRARLRPAVAAAWNAAQDAHEAAAAVRARVQVDDPEDRQALEDLILQFAAGD